MYQTEKKNIFWTGNSIQNFKAAIMGRKRKKQKKICCSCKCPIPIWHHCIILIDFYCFTSIHDFCSFSSFSSFKADFLVRTLWESSSFVYLSREILRKMFKLCTLQRNGILKILKRVNGFLGGLWSDFKVNSIMIIFIRIDWMNRISAQS